MLIEGNTGDCAHITIERNEAIKCGPETITVHRQNHFVDILTVAKNVDGAVSGAPGN